MDRVKALVVDEPRVAVTSAGRRHHRSIDGASERPQPWIDPGECVADKLPTGRHRRSRNQSATANQKGPPVDPIHLAILRLALSSSRTGGSSVSDQSECGPQSMAEMIDSVLKARVRAVLDGRPATEAELRKLFEEGRACVLILDGQLENGERRLRELASDPESSIADLAAAFRRVNELRPERAELDEVLAELETRAREFRASWLLLN
jgi:hypothetical protein